MMFISRNARSIGFLALVAVTIGCGAQPHGAHAESSQQPDAIAPAFDYPGVEPLPFLAEVIRSDDAELAVALSPGLDEIFFTRISVDEKGMNLALLHSKWVDGQWTVPVPAPFASEHRDAEAFFDSTGDRLFFYSGRPEPDSADPSRVMNLWTVERTPAGWGEPRLLGRPDAPIGYAWSGCLVDDVDLYFTARPLEDTSLADIFKVPIHDDGFGVAESLGPPINTVDHMENEPAVSPDGSFMVFYSAGRPDNLSEEILGDLYISFRTGDESWTEPRHIDEPINSVDEENWPRITADGKYLIFSSNRRAGVDFPDLYWVSTQALERYRPADPS